MKYCIPIFAIVFLLSACNSFQIRKKTDSQVREQSPKESTYTPIEKNPSPSYNPQYGEIASVVNHAKTYLGTPYRSGGTTASGMDCSGLVLTSFAKQGIDLPRVSRDQANAGKNVSQRNAQSGDLIFFNTSGSGISHVGIIERIENDEIFFIHASSSKGVMISSLENSYWKPRFVKIVRVAH